MVISADISSQVKFSKLDGEMIGTDFDTDFLRGFFNGKLTKCKSKIEVA
jgi:hypothetical protein